MLLLSAFPRHIQLAFGELNTREILGPRHNPRIIAYHATTKLKATTDEVAWCSSFANAVVTWSGFKGTDSAAALSWLDWGEPCAEPVLGCVAVYRRGDNPKQGHVGFPVGRCTNGDIALLAGNQGNEVSVDPYPNLRLLGFRVLPEMLS